MKKKAKSYLMRYTDWHDSQISDGKVKKQKQNKKNK